MGQLQSTCTAPPFSRQSASTPMRMRLPSAGVSPHACIAATNAPALAPATGVSGVISFSSLSTSHAPPAGLSRTPGGCQVGYMCDQNSTYGLHSLPGGVRLVSWTAVAVRVAVMGLSWATVVGCMDYSSSSCRQLSRVLAA
jgi:hypothetical protein